jgi:hypothetical protein
MWDGDGFIKYNSDNLFNKDIYCFINHMRPKDPILPSVIEMDGLFYAPTRFMACIKGHVYGGIIKYNKDSNPNAIIYDNDG